MLLCALAASLLALLAVAMLERQRSGLSVERVRLAGAPVSIWRAEGSQGGPLVVVAHGYAGSRQMMQPLAMSFARAGFVVASFDFFGHGRHDRPMAGDITSLDGATAQLVDQTVAVARASRDLPGATGPVSLVGHSMATDIVIRAAERIDDVAAVVAISMYSDAVRPTAPERLLIVSGAWEGWLREVALDRLRQLDPAAAEGETVARDGVARRAVAAPGVGHVGVLYSRATLAETRNWIAAATGRQPVGALPRTGPWLALLLVALVALAWPLAGLLGRPVRGTAPGMRLALAASAAPIVPALVTAALLPGGALGLSAFGTLAAFFGVWGAVQLAILWRAGLRPSRPHLAGLAMLLLWGLCLFAPALDRYGAAFLPTGPRLQVMVLLLPGTLLYCLADAMLVRDARWLSFLEVRVFPLATLLGAMWITPRLGIAFTVLPVMVLFWCVYGVAGRWIGARSGSATNGLALGIILAWAIAASTPLIAA